VIIGLWIGDTKANRHPIEEWRLWQNNAPTGKVFGNMEAEFVDPNTHRIALKQWAIGSPIAVRVGILDLFWPLWTVNSPQFDMDSGSRAAVDGIQHMGGEFAQ
jgi:hypothetical protein